MGRYSPSGTVKLLSALLAVTCFPLMTVNAFACEPQKYSAAFDACMASGEAAEGVTYAMAECLEAELLVQDQALNGAYKATISALEEDQRDRLRAAQRAWVQYRDLKCASEASSGGTADRLNGPGCLIGATMERTAELVEFADGF